MGLFNRKSKDDADLKCKICVMEFSNSERTMRHMVRAHSKPQRVKKRLGSGKYD